MIPSATQRFGRARPLALVCFVSLLGTAAQAQIFTENAGVTSPETPVWREYFGYLDSAHASEFTWGHQLIVSPRRQDEFKLTVPTAWRRFDDGAGDVSFSGFADASLRWKHALQRDDDVMRSGRFSLLTEVSAPTGDDRDSQSGSTIPRDLRLSNGTWNFGLGAAYTVIDDRERFAVEAVVRHATTHAGFDPGDSAELNLAYWYRLAPAVFADLEGTAELRATVELLTSVQGSSSEFGTRAEDDGALMWFAPGLQYFPKSWLLLEAAVQLPVLQTIDDSRGDRQLGAWLAIKFLF